MMGGEFDLDSAPGQGTRVRLIAPRDSAPDATGVDAVAGRAIGSAIAAVKPAAADALTILVVDDHDTMRRTIRDVLAERPQLSVIGEAANGIEAIECARALRPDVILMDVAMPQMDGIEATARIHAELPDIEILGLSMHSRNEVGEAIEQAGAAGYFVKGTDTRQLVEHLLRLHAERRGR
jgi:CheY-like chemotaxis protein